MLITRFFLSPFWRWWSCLPELFSRVRSLKAHARALLLAHTRSLALAALKKTATNLTNDTGDRLGFLDRADTMKWLNWLPPRCTSPLSYIPAPGLSHFLRVHAHPHCIFSRAHKFCNGKRVFSLAPKISEQENEELYLCIFVRAHAWKIYFEFGFEI